jgi:hypothetical protein
MDHLSDLKLQLQAIEKDFNEDFPGQFNEIRRDLIINQAVQAADEILTELADGSVEELDYLTGQVAYQFAEKVRTGLSCRLLREDMNRRIEARSVRS